MLGAGRLATHAYVGWIGLVRLDGVVGVRKQREARWEGVKG